MPSIKFDSGVIEVDVNNGTILIKDDAEFIKAALGLRTTFKGKTDEYTKMTAENSTATPEEQASAVDAIFADTDAAVDALFGAGACERIFLEPRTQYQYEMFFDGLLQIMDERQAERAKTYAKNLPQNRQQRREQMREAMRNGGALPAYQGEDNV